MIHYDLLTLEVEGEVAQVGSIGQELAQHERPEKLRRLICEDEPLEARHAGEGERVPTAAHMSQVSRVSIAPTPAAR